MSCIHLEIADRIAVLRLDNPAKMNAISADMLGQLCSHLDELDRHRDVSCVLVTAQGERAFCTGADIGAWSGLSPVGFARYWVRDGHRIFDRLARLSRPTIAVIHGKAFGGGLELAAACDLRVVAPDATFALPEAGVGIVPGWSGTQRLARLLPEPVLKEMAVFGRCISASHALSIGFVAEVAEDPYASALKIGRKADELSTRSTEIAKNMIHAAQGEDRGAMIESLGAAAIAGSKDRAEGVQAFREKRKPVFSDQ